MDEYFEIPEMKPEEIPAEEFYNNYYLETREDGAIVDAWSDGPFGGRDTEGYIQFGQGGYQLRLTVDGVETEENPPLFDMDGIPLYKYENGKIKRRTAEEIEQEREAIPVPPPSPIEQLRADVDFILVLNDLT